MKERVLSTGLNNQPQEHRGSQTVADDQPHRSATKAYNQLLARSDNDLLQSVRSLNTQQRQGYEKLLSGVETRQKTSTACNLLKFSQTICL